MFAKQEPDVLVTGAGPVGLYAALCLNEESIRCQIIDKERRPASHSYALALHPRSLQLLSELGIDPDGIDETLRIDTVAFYDHTHRVAEMHLGDLPLRYPYMLVIRQSRLERLLEHELARRKIHVGWRHRLAEFSDTGSELFAEIEQLDQVSTGYPIAMAECEVVKRFHRKPRFIVGADGYHSFVRRHLGIDSESIGTPQVFGVFEFDGDEAPANEVRVVLHEGRTNVLWPLPDGRVRWSFQMDHPDQDGDMHYKSRLAVQVGPDYFPHLTADLLRETVAARAPWFGEVNGTIYWSVMARFERRVARRFGDGRVWLAGDSAHLTGPVGVQSMNVGFLEARDVARRMARCQRGQESLETFDAYDRHHRSEWMFLLGMDGAARPRVGASEWVREHWQEILPCIPASGSELRSLGEQIGLEFMEEEPCEPSSS